MRYPSLEEYAEALQHPPSALLDPTLHNATVQCNAFGLPVPFSGGFAVTFRCVKDNHAYALRCFHRYVESLEKRYDAISGALGMLHSQYTVDFEYCRRGVRVSGREYPAVRMQWVRGNTLGEFLSRNRTSPAKLNALAQSVRRLAEYLDSQGIAHGDIQPGNIIVSADGRTLKIIDYDGMYVPALAGAGASEDGQVNFQHPDRRGQWSPHLDRFSFCVLWLGIQALSANPALWDSTQSDSDAILLRANDFRSPSGSETLRKIATIEPLARYAEALAEISTAPFSEIPTLEVFIRRPPQSKASPLSSEVSRVSPYVAAYPVLNAANYTACLRHQGERVEIIGRIVDIKEGITRRGKRPYMFVNFGEWHGEIVKIAIWSRGRDVLPQRPGPTWNGRWVSCVGLLEPPYTNDTFGYRHLCISVTKAGQLTLLPEHVAQYRLGLHPIVESSSGPVVSLGPLHDSGGQTRWSTKKTCALVLGIILLGLLGLRLLPRVLPSGRGSVSGGPDISGSSPTITQPLRPQRPPKVTLPGRVTDGRTNSINSVVPKNNKAPKPASTPKKKVYKQSAVTTTKAEGLLETMRDSAPGYEQWYANKTRVALDLLEQARVRSRLSDGTESGDEVRRLREQAIHELKTCAQGYTGLLAGTKEADRLQRLRTVRAAIYEQIAVA